MSDIAEDIQAAMGSLENGEPETGGEPEGVLETAIDTDIPEGEEGEETTAPVKALEPPSNWSEQDKATFKAAPPEVQEWALRRHNDMEAAFTKKTQEIAEFRRGYEPVEQMFAPHMEELRAQGTTPADVIQRWYQAEQFLTRSPVEGLQWLAQTFGVDLGQVAAGKSTEGAAVDTTVQALKQELSELKTAWTQREQAEVRTRQQAITNDIQTFAAEVDGSGQPAHPHFDDVVQDMVLLAQAERAAGRTPVLKDLYEKAVWANPSTREKVLVSQREAEAKKSAAEARAKAAAARKAGSSVTGAPTTGGSQATELSLREQLEASFRQSA